MKPYLGTNETVCKQFKTDVKTGLTLAQAKERLIAHGYNELQSQKTPSVILIFLSQFNDALTYLLVAAAVAIFLLNKPLDAFIISGILLFNGIIGTIQEYRSENILQTLHKFLKTESIVIRNGNEQIISSKFLVPGDIIVIKAGDKIPADARILSCSLLSVDESMLTGETQPVGKVATPISKNYAHLYDQNNMLFQGTYALSGQATAIITTTGIHTQAGQLQKNINTLSTSIPLQQELLQLSYWILYTVITICGILALIGLFTGRPFPELFTMVIALFICIIPESLPMVMTLVMITSAYKMAQQHVLVKKLKVMQDLGRVDVIITDKTGTLTRNEMMISNVYIQQKNLSVSGSGYFTNGQVQNEEQHQQALQEAALACALLNSSKIEFNAALNLFKIKGDPTQAAAAVFAKKINPEIDHIKDAYEIKYNIPFDYQARYHATFVKHQDSHTAYIMGAPEVILPWCNNNTPDIAQALQGYLQQGMRVLALAKKSYCPTDEKNYNYHSSLVEHNIEFMALLCMQDALRDDVPVFVKEALQAGIKIIIATGDHKDTALYIAKKSGVCSNNIALTGEEFDDLDDQQAIQALKTISVCARFSPQNKLRLVELFHQQHKIVAMTGDGVNDAPALSFADIGIAMGNIGTELTKQSADIILLKDSFQHIMGAIKQGRHVFYSLRRTFLFFLASNMAEILIVFIALAFMLPLPLLPAQILWLNLIADGFLDAALALEPMQNIPLPKLEDDIAQTIFDKTLLYKMFLYAIPMSITCLSIFLYYQAHTSIEYARTMTLFSMVMFQWYNIFNCRSENRSLFSLGFFSNRWLIISCVAVFGLQILLIYAPFMQMIFSTVPLHPSDFLLACSIPAIIIVIDELRKKLNITYF